ncbi:MAG TPA: RtcB family protein, partial [Dehalococcoidia bacterium]|nr:RtcB family protein [Dehalococcoidia bacterium]
MSLKYQCKPTDEGYYRLDEGVKVPVRLFLNEKLYAESEESLYYQVQTATEYPGVLDVVITPDTHHGYVVPVGCVIATDGTLLQAAAGYDIGCFTADTLVPLVDGNSYPIGELAAREEEILVYAITVEHKVVVARATARKTRCAASLVRVTLDNGREIGCTPDHEFMLRDGSYRPVQALMPGTLLMPFQAALTTEGCVAVELPVEVLDMVADVYCLTVPEYGNFALDAGVFVHNCGMMSFRSTVPREKGLDDRLRRKFSEEVMKRIGLGVGQGGLYQFTAKQFQEIIRFGASALGYERGNSERDFIPVDDGWSPPHKPVERGIGQLGSLGAGNHFCELQYDQHGHLWTMVHTGSRGFGHGLASHFIRAGKEELQKRGLRLKGGAEAVYFEPDSPLYFGYKNAVAAGANFAIANRLLIWQGVGKAFRRVFGQEPELVYEISHNLIQEEVLPDGRAAWIHRKGATRAFPAGHPLLAGTKWEATGHPVLIPGSMGDQSFILMPKAGAAKSL